MFRGDQLNISDPERRRADFCKNVAPSVRQSWFFDAPKIDGYFIVFHTWKAQDT